LIATHNRGVNHNVVLHVRQNAVLLHRLYKPRHNVGEAGHPVVLAGPFDHVVHILYGVRRPQGNSRSS
jgi:hypothetical protein